MTLLTDLYERFNPSRLKFERAQYSNEKARAQAALDSVNSEIGFRQLEDPREQAELRASLAARGLSKSSIANQDTARLSDIQMRRMAAMRRNKMLSERGLSLIRKQRRFSRRMAPLEVWGMMEKYGQQAAGAAMGGGGG